jgi:hypothetical protein
MSFRFHKFINISERGAKATVDSHEWLVHQLPDKTHTKATTKPCISPSKPGAAMDIVWLTVIGLLVYAGIRLALF